MSQISFAEAEYQNKKRKTRREKFLERMDQLIPWKKLEKKVARYFRQGRQRPPTIPAAGDAAHPLHAAVL